MSAMEIVAPCLKRIIVSFLPVGSGALVLLHGFRAWEGKTVSFFWGGSGV